MNTTLQTSIRSYCEQLPAGQRREQPIDLSGKDLSSFDLRHLDLGGVNLTRANLANVRLDGARLQGATITGAQFPQVSVAALLAAGITPRDLLRHRSQADRRMFQPLHFSPELTSSTSLPLTGKECSVICQALRTNCWEELSDERVFSHLYADQLWDEWMTRCASRTILDWALAHRAVLNRFMDAIPFYGRVLPTTLINEVVPSDLVAGTKTNPQRVFHDLGIRQIIKQSDLDGENVPYPVSPYGDATGIAQIQSRQGLQLEGGLMHHCVASYDEECLAAQCFMYHVGPSAPLGSTLELYADGYPGQHRAAHNRAPSQEVRDVLKAWFEERGIEFVTGELMEQVCARLKREGVVEVTFQIYWYEDQDIIDAVDAVNAQGQSVMLETVNDEELWQLVTEEHGSDDNGSWKLSVADQELLYDGEATPPDDDDYYNDESDDEDEDEDEEDENEERGE